MTEAYGSKKLGNCDIFVKRKILVIKEMKQDKISLKPKVCDPKHVRVIPLTFVKVLDKSWPNFGHFSVHKQKLTKLRQYFTVFPSHLKKLPSLLREGQH